MKKSNTKKSTSKDAKLPQIKNNNQKNKSPNPNKTSQSKNTKTNNKNMKDVKSNNNIKVLKTASNINDPNAASSKIAETMEKRKKRLEQEKKEEEKDKKIYEQVLKEFQENKARTNTETNVRKRLTSPKNKDFDINSIKLPKLKISEKRTQTILEEGGMLDAYKYLIVQLCKNGLPTGNLFEYSAFVIRNYEKKWKEKKSKMNKEKIEQYWKEKKEQVENFNADKKKINIKNVKEEENKIKALNKSLEQREINKLIQSMDRSRSSRNNKLFSYSKNKSELKLPAIDDKIKVSVNQKEEKSNKASPKKGNKQSKSPTNTTAKKNEKVKSPAPSQKKPAAKKKK
jgi:hypothetical protein